MTLPQVSVFEEFSIVPAEITAPLRPMIFGPEYELHRFAVAGETTPAGVYNPALASTFTWVNLGMNATSIADSSYTSVTMVNSDLEYLSLAATYSSSSNLPNNSFDSGETLATGNGFTLISGLNNRPVQAGDWVFIVGENLAANAITSSSAQVSAVLGEYVAPVIGASVAGPGVATQAQTISATLLNVSNTVNVNVATSETDSTYNGLASGYMTETYTVTVMQSAVGTNPSTAVFNVVSASGTDTVLNYSPTATSFATAIPIGTRGLSILFTQTGTDTFVAGQKFVFVVQGAFTAPTVTFGGTYKGSSNTTYMLTCTTGGTSPVVTVSTNNGVDASGPVSLVLGSPVAIGNNGLTVTFTGTISLFKGAQFYVPVTAGGNTGKLSVVQLNAPILKGFSYGSLSVIFAVRRTFTLDQFTNVGDNVANWSQDSTGITINTGAQGTDPSWHDSSGNLLPMNVLDGQINITFRGLLQAHANQIYSLSAGQAINSVFTTKIDPANPLVYAISKALLNSNGTGIRFMAVATDDLAGYNTVLTAMTSRSDIYSCIPLTQDTTIQQAVVGHVMNMSSPTYNLRRVGILSLPSTSTGEIAGIGSDGNPLLATFSGTGNTTVTVSNAEFITDGVAANDMLYTSFSVDASGNTTHQTYVVETVVDQNTLTLVSGPAVAPGIPQLIQVWRNLNSSGVAAQVISEVGAFSGNSGRIWAVYPGTISSGGVMVNGYNLCAAIGGLVGGVAPQQPLTNVNISGFDNAWNVSTFFSRPDLDAMAAAGVWIVTSPSGSSTVYTRQDLTTDTQDGVAQTLAGVIKNTDSIAYFLSAVCAPYIGRANGAPSTIASIQTNLTSAIAALTSNPLPLAGPQLISGSIVSMILAPTGNSLAITITGVEPIELDYINLYLQV